VLAALRAGIKSGKPSERARAAIGFGGGFFGDCTDLAVGSDNVFHAFWTDSNNKQSVVWFHGFQFVPTPINQEDVAAASGNY
jgi:hypothetical protein